MADLGMGVPSQVAAEDVQDRTASTDPTTWDRKADESSSELDPEHNFIITPESVQRFAYYQRDGLDSIVSRTNLEVRYRASDSTGVFVLDPTVNIINEHRVNSQNRTDEYGKRLNNTEVTPETGELLGEEAVNWSSRGYSGQVYDKESATYYYGSRNYDPSNGTWTKQDSYRGEYNRSSSRNRYSFVENDPVNEIDQYGYWFGSKWVDKGKKAFNTVRSGAKKYGGVIFGAVLVNPNRTKNVFQDLFNRYAPQKAKDTVNKVKAEYDRCKADPRSCQTRASEATKHIVGETTSAVSKAIEPIVNVVKEPPTPTKIKNYFKELSVMGGVGVAELIGNQYINSWKMGANFAKNMASAIYDDPAGMVKGYYGFGLKLARDGGNLMLAGYNLGFDAESKLLTPVFNMLGYDKGVENLKFIDQVIKDTDTEWNKDFNREIRNLGITPDKNAGGGFNNICYLTEGLCNMMADGINGDRPTSAQASYNMYNGLLEATMLYELAKAAGGATRGVDDVGKTSKNLTNVADPAENIRVMVKPKAGNPKLQNTIDELYRSNSKVGNGSTADAIRYELETGNQVGGKSHIGKGEERIRNLKNIIEKENLSDSDRQIAEDLIRDLEDAMKGGKR